jgi:hypothetical protein
MLIPNRHHESCVIQDAIRVYRAASVPATRLHDVVREKSKNAQAVPLKDQLKDHAAGGGKSIEDKRLCHTDGLLAAPQDTLKE